MLTWGEYWDASATVASGQKKKLASCPELQLIAVQGNETQHYMQCQEITTYCTREDWGCHVSLRFPFREPIFRHASSLKQVPLSKLYTGVAHL